MVYTVSRNSFRAVLILTALAALGACTAPSKFKLDFEDVDGGLVRNQIKVMPVTMDDQAAVNQAVMAYDMGKFSREDLKTIEQSLTNSLQQFNSTQDQTLRVHLHIHRYIQSFSNIRGAALIIADWCLESDGVPIHSEMVYSAYSSVPLAGGSIGGTKDYVNEAMVARIGEVTWSYAIPGYKPKDVELVYLDAESAAKALPEKMGGTLLGLIGAPGALGAQAAGTLVGGAVGGEIKSKSVFRKAGESVQPIDWAARLGNQPRNSE